MTSDGPTSGRAARAAGAVVVVALVVVAAALAGPWRMRPRPQGVFNGLLDIPTPPVRPGPTAQPLPAQTTQPAHGDAMTVVLTALVVAVLVVLLVLVARLLRRVLREHRAQRIEDDAPPGRALDDYAGGAMPAVEQGLHAAMRALGQDLPPGNAVIAAWMALEAAAESSGVPRGRAQTPTEFTVAVLDRTRADPSATRQLLDLYLQARFSSHPLTHKHVAVAYECLTRLEEGLTRRRTGA